MKKNIILGLFAAVLALVSAFAMPVPETAWVSAKITSSQPEYTCQPTSVACSNAGPNPCAIQVNTILRGPVVTFGKRGYVSCFPVLTTASTSAIVTSDWYYDVQY